MLLCMWCCVGDAAGSRYSAPLLYDTGSQSSTSSTAAIAGGVAGGVAALGILAALLMLFVIRRRRARGSENGSRFENNKAAGAAMGNAFRADRGSSSRILGDADPKQIEAIMGAFGQVVVSTTGTSKTSAPHSDEVPDSAPGSHYDVPPPGPQPLACVMMAMEPPGSSASGAQYQQSVECSSSLARMTFGNTSRTVTFTTRGNSERSTRTNSTNRSSNSNRSRTANGNSMSVANTVHEDLLLNWADIQLFSQIGSGGNGTVLKGKWQVSDASSVAVSLQPAAEVLKYLG